MGNPAMLCAFRTRKMTAAYGHALPYRLVSPLITAHIGTDISVLLIGDVFVAQGISVPISRGGPPLALE